MSDEYYELYQQCKLERDQLKQQLEEAVEVIEFYGDKDTYEYITSKSLIMNIKENCIGEDVGNKARQFLAKYRGGASDERN